MCFNDEAPTKNGSPPTIKESLIIITSENMNHHDAPGSDSHTHAEEAGRGGLEPTRIDRPGLPRNTQTPGSTDRPTLAMKDVQQDPVVQGAAISGKRVVQAISMGFGLPPEDQNGIWENPLPAPKPITGLGSDEQDFKDAEFVEVDDPLASGRTTKEFATLVSNLDDWLRDGNTDQVRIILDELKPHLILLRPEHVQQVMKACPLLDNPAELLSFFEEAYPKEKDVVPEGQKNMSGVSQFQASIRELGKALSLIFRNMALSTGIEKLRALAEGRYEYKFIDFRDSLVRNDNEAPKLTQELTYWLMQLTAIEKQVITKNWRVPPAPAKIVEHLANVYPDRFQNYILQIFAERLNSLFAHSTIPDDATTAGYTEAPTHIHIIKEAQYLAIIWDGKLPLPPEPPAQQGIGRVTDRVLKAEPFKEA